MKKEFLALMVFSTIFFSSCQDPIYFEILKDVPPTEATVLGNITAITRTTVANEEYLVINSVDGIRYKKHDGDNHGQWVTFTNPPCVFKVSYDETTLEFTGEQLLKVLSSEDTLYAVTAVYSYSQESGTSIVDYIKLYGINLSSWQDNSEWKIIIDKDKSKQYFPLVMNSSDYQESQFAVFQTNAPMKEHRFVYIRSGNSSPVYYKLDGLSAPAKETVTLTDGTSSLANSAVYFDSKVLFFKSPASTTNETYSQKATRYYYAIDGTLYGNDANNTTINKKFIDIGSQISSLAVCSNSILIGLGDFSKTNSTGGIKRVLLSNGNPNSYTSEFDSNASYQFTSSYMINCLLNATPGESENNSCLYIANSFSGNNSTSNASFKNIGLWSYYPSRGNWNRE